MRISPFDLVLKSKGLKKMIGAEIGVGRGDHALSLLTNLDTRRLYLIDPYIINPLYPEKVNKDNYRCAVESIKEIRKTRRVRWILKKAGAALPEIPDGSLDFVYLDGDHTYESLIKEIPAWEVKVKIGGLVGGHDYHQSRMDVIKAVNQYCLKFKKVDLKIQERDWFYWRKR